MVLDDLSRVIEQLGGSDPVAFADVESVEALHRHLARLEAFTTAATAAFDTSGNWEPDGARSAAAWLVARCRLPRARARRLVRRGRELRRLPACGRAWADGAITADQVDAIATLRVDATEAALVRDEEMLVMQGSTLRYDSFVRALAYWKQLADPDGADEADERRLGRRDVYLESSFRGMWLGRITLDPVSGSIVAGELERIEQELFEADWAEARTLLGREPNSTDLARSGGQRRADALVEMATRSRTAPEDGRRPAPLFSVLVDYDTIHGRICELADGTAVSPGSLPPWFDGAYLERVVFGPGRRVEVGRTTRLFTGATRRAIELRDRECAHPYCDVPAASCEVDHVVPFALGGATTQENGRMLCGFHNRSRNRGRRPDD